VNVIGRGPQASGIGGDGDDPEVLQRYPGIHGQRPGCRQRSVCDRLSFDRDLPSAGRAGAYPHATGLTRKSVGRLATTPKQRNDEDGCGRGDEVEALTQRRGGEGQ